jgi:hypothetical protein
VGENLVASESMLYREGNPFDEDCLSLLFWGLCSGRVYIALSPGVVHEKGDEL